MSEWRKIRIQDYYKEAVGEKEYAYVTPEVYEILANTFGNSKRAPAVDLYLKLTRDLRGKLIHPRGQ